jgi:hypothetical protein
MQSPPSKGALRGPSFAFHGIPPIDDLRGCNRLTMLALDTSRSEDPRPVWPAQNGGGHDVQPRDDGASLSSQQFDCRVSDTTSEHYRQSGLIFTGESGRPRLPAISITEPDSLQPTTRAMESVAAVMPEPLSSYPLVLRKGFHVELDHDRAVAYPRGNQLWEVSVIEPKNKKSLLKCPVFEADKVLGRPHTCSGVVAENMSELRRHLTRGNRPHVPFLKLCPTCNEDILDRDEFEHAHGSHGELCNNPQRQRRGTSADVQWKILYGKLYPKGNLRLMGDRKYPYLISDKLLGLT